MRSHRFPFLMFIISFVAGMTFFVSNVEAAIVDFEDLALDPESQWHGPDPDGTIVHQTSPFPYTYTSGKFTSGGVDFHNNCDADGYWSGWAYSNKTYNPSDYMPGDYNPGDGSNGNPHPVPTGWTSQYNAASGCDANGSAGSADYGICYTFGDMSATAITLPNPTSVQGAFFSTNNYQYYSMKEGDPAWMGNFAANKFTASRQDYLRLIITGKDSGGNAIGAPLNFYLADFRDPGLRTDDPRKDNYIVNQWTWVDLSGFGGAVKSLEFDMESSDYNENGILTPTYFLIDNLATGPKPLWSGAANNKWSNAANWNSGQKPGSGHNIILNNNANANIDLDGNQNVASITIDGASAGAYTLNNNTLKLDAGGSVKVTNAVTTSQTLNCKLALAGNGFFVNDSVAPGQKLNIAGDINSDALGGVQNLVLSGAGDGIISGTVGDGTSGGILSLTKQGAGVWTLSNNTAYGGETIIEEGLLQLNGTVSDLHAISGDGNLGVGDGTNHSVLIVDSIMGDTLNIAAGSELVIRPISGGLAAGSSNVTPVPEPSAFVLLGIAALGLFIWRMRSTFAPL
jgi:autotransporter-associated beta strand protein